MRQRWLVLLVGFAFIVNPSTVSACTCAPFSKPQAVENASVIFAGTVTGTSRGFPFGLGCTVSSADPILVTFHVESIYKGDAPRQVTVFATGAVDKPETNLCRGNVEGAIAPAEYGLAAGRPPS